ncbi:FLUCTUATING-LIGHT-ACCLIMATION protein 1, chloroplastic-like [Apium graveolens]|uniref:FLUCTUATING-LIGHT-ACCLIMATION protein 1, chloroplastic-like n=1 Tax=Apium graveolens TaxID=4045 RepID=UPI003D7A0193
MCLQPRNTTWFQFLGPGVCTCRVSDNIYHRLWPSPPYHLTSHGNFVRCHSATIPKPVWVIICLVFVLAVIEEVKHQNSISDDTNKDNVQAPVADIRKGSVLMVQVGIVDKKRELQRKLYRIAGTADTYTMSGLNNLKKEVVKALLEHHDSCHFAYLFAKYDDMEKYSRPCFRGFLETELAKFEKEDETFVNVDGVICKKDSGGNVNSIDNEYSVVTLLVLADGEYWIPSVKWHTPLVNKVDVKTALQKILSIPRSNLEALEVLWTPQTEKDSISEQELRRDFGLLMRPVKLIKKRHCK